MQFHECIEGDYRIHVGALETQPGGYIAALVIKHRPLAIGGACAAEQTVHRDDSVACGYRWQSADSAIAYALARGRDFVRRHAQEPKVSRRSAA
jgi:hypothetical protein